MAESIPSLSIFREKDIRIVEFISSRILDDANIQDINQGLTALVDELEKPKLLLDFSNVEHLSSAALGMLISTDKRVKERNGQLRLTNIKPQIYEVFKITRLNALFKILPSRADGVASFLP